MNKYLTKRNELAKELEKEFNMPAYEIFRKLDLANDLDYILDEDEYSKYNLTDEQQESIIQISYDFDMSLEESHSAYLVVKAVTKTLLEYETYFDFINDYETKYSATYDKMVWNFV